MKMKKLISLVLALMMACMLIPAMAEGQDVTGDWYLTDVSGMNVANLGMSMIITLNADGTAKVSMEMQGEKEEKEGTWALEEGKVVVTIDGDPLSLELVDGKLTADMGGQTGTFGREPAEAVATEFAEEKTDATAEEFEGSWKATYMSVMGMSIDVETAVSAGQLEALPMLTMKEGQMSLEGLGSMNMFGEGGLQLTFADGKYSFSMTLGESTISIELAMLQDGTLRMNMSAGQEIALYFAKAE